MPQQRDATSATCDVSLLIRSPISSIRFNPLPHALFLYVCTQLHRNQTPRRYLDP